MEKRVTGLGGIFFQSDNPKTLKEWYRDNLGFQITPYGATFIWRAMDQAEDTFSRTEWSPFGDTSYFQPSTHPYMFNYRVHDLEGLLKVLKEEGVQLAGDPQFFEYGKFGWILDPENRKIELWEPVDDKFGDAPSVWDDRVTGIGGVFFKSEDPEAMKSWYAKHLGIGEFFFWHDMRVEETAAHARTVWCPFPASTEYFLPAKKPFMFNYRVKDLATLLTKLTASGVSQVGAMESYPYGKFAWVLDPEGNKIELWEPNDEWKGE